MRSKTLLNMNCFKPTNMRLLRATLLIGLSGILSAQKRRISTLRLENSSTRTKRLSMKMPIRDSDVFNTQRDLTAGIVGKSIGLKMLPKHVANAHQKGDIHYHDLDYSPYTPMTNCCLIDFEGMLRNGFKIGNAEVESPKSIQTATAQISQIIANVASSQYGGAQLTGSMRSWPLMQKRTTKTLGRCQRVGASLKSRRTMLGARLKKISMMPCNRWNMRSIPSLPQTDKLPLLRLVLVLGTNRFEREIQRRFWKSESRDLDRNIGPLSFQN